MPIALSSADHLVCLAGSLQSGRRGSDVTQFEADRAAAYAQFPPADGRSMTGLFFDPPPCLWQVALPSLTTLPFGASSADRRFYAFRGPAGAASTRLFGVPTNSPSVSSFAPLGCDMMASRRKSFGFELHGRVACPAPRPTSMRQSQGASREIRLPFRVFFSRPADDLSRHPPPWDRGARRPSGASS